MHLRGKNKEQELQATSDPERLIKEIKKKSIAEAQGKQQEEEGEKFSPSSPQKSASSSLHISDSDSENTLMAERPRQTLGDYAAPQGPRNNSPMVLSADALALEIKPAYYNLILSHPFTGKDHEDPHAHLEIFYDLVGTMGLDSERVEDAYKRLFHHSLLGEAREWYKNLPNQIFQTWAEAETAFLARFYPPSKVVSARTEISTFKQGNEESFYEAWERFRRLLRKCPNHGLPEIAQLNIFCTGLRHDWKIHLDAAAGGSMMSTDVNTALTIINNMANNDRAGQQGRVQVPKSRGVMELTTSDALLAQNKLITQQIELLNKNFAKLMPQQAKAVNQPQQDMLCEICGGNHPCDTCPQINAPHEELQFVNQQRQGNFSNPTFRTNNPSYAQQGWRNTYNQGNWRGEAGPSTRPPFQQQSHYQQGQSSTDQRLNKLEDTLEKFMQASLTNQKNTEASMRSLETQVGQLAKEFAEQRNDQFSANTQPNPKEHCKSITTRSGKVIGRDIGSHLEVEKEVVEKKKRNEKRVRFEEKIESEKEEMSEGRDESEKEGEENKSEDVNREKIVREKIERKSESAKEEKLRRKSGDNDIPQLKDLPYPKTPSKKDQERQYARFLDIFKRLQINIPFMEAMEQMPTYARFMKELLTRKRKVPEETVRLEEKCSAIIQKTLPMKAKDPGSFTIPVTIGSLPVGKALLDLGASINLMPLSMVKRIRTLEVKPTRMILQLANRSVISPYGVAEDVLVKVDKFVFPVDFVIVDMEEDQEVPLILGRSFMKTAKALIDVDEGKLIVRIDDDEVKFNVFEALHYLEEDHHQCHMVDIVEQICEIGENQVIETSPLEKELIDAYSEAKEEEEQEIEESLEELEDPKERDDKGKIPLEKLPEAEKSEESKLELKLLPSHLKYVFLEEGGNKPVVISNKLTPREEKKLIEVLKANEGAIGWTLSDLKGISPSYCMHRIFMEEDFKPIRQP